MPPKSCQHADTAEPPAALVRQGLPRAASAAQARVLSAVTIVIPAGTGAMMNRLREVAVKRDQLILAEREKEAAAKAAAAAAAEPAALPAAE